MITWLVPRQDLTPDQARVVELPPTINRVVLGMAGSGKTQVLVHRAAHLAEKFNIPPERYRVFVFTNVIKEYIRSGLEFLNLPDRVVSTFDFWCGGLFQKHFGPRLPRKPNGRDIDFPAIRRRVRGLIRATRDLQNSLEFVLVDEGQDLTPEAYEIIQEAASHVTVFADPQQKIFDDGADAGFIADRLHVTTPQISILGAFRNAIYVAELAGHFIEDLEKRAQFLAHISAAQRVKERPLCYVADSFDREMDRLAEVVRARQVLNERIGIIVPTNRLLHGLADGLAERGIQVEKAATKENAGKVEVTCAFTNLVPKIATFFMAKGLTFDSVLLPRLTAKAYYYINRERMKRMMFVGIARATQWVYLSTVKGTEFDEMGVLREAVEQGHLTMQRSEEWRAGADIGQEKKRRGSEDRRDSSKQEPEEDDFSVL
jgi:superfamily I DNA/RNA helicase